MLYLSGIQAARYAGPCGLIQQEHLFVSSVCQLGPGRSQIPINEHFKDLLQSWWKHSRLFILLSGVQGLPHGVAFLRRSGKFCQGSHSQDNLGKMQRPKSPNPVGLWPDPSACWICSHIWDTDIKGRKPWHAFARTVKRCWVAVICAMPTMHNLLWCYWP